MKEFIVKKEFLSDKAYHCYKPGEMYKGGRTRRTCMLLKYGFIAIKPVKLQPKRSRAIDIVVHVHDGGKSDS